jgi:hypothetical protein
LEKLTYGNDKYFEILGTPRIPYGELDWAGFVIEEDLKICVESLEALSATKRSRNWEFRLKKPFIGGEGIQGESWITGK